MKAAREILASALHDNMENQSKTNFQLRGIKDELAALTKVAEDLLVEAAELKDALSALEQYSKPTAFYENKEEK